MGKYLYRGINLQKFTEDNRKLIPHGKSPEDEYVLSQIKCLKDVQTLSSSAENTVYGHQKDNSVFDSCYLSTSTDIEVAKKFATYDGYRYYALDGVVVVLDRSKFEEYGVVEHPALYSGNSHEKEITIRAADSGVIPEEVIIEVIEVKSLS